MRNGSHEKTGVVPLRVEPTNLATYLATGRPLLRDNGGVSSGKASHQKPRRGWRKEVPHRRGDIPYNEFEQEVEIDAY